MRWTDLPMKPIARTVSDWAEGMRTAGGVAASAVDAVIARALERCNGDHPVVALQRSAITIARDYLGASRLERGGLLVGTPIVRAAGDTNSVLVHVRATVPGLEDDATALSLRLAAGVWDAARAALREHEVVVGWVHSHPGIGAFFSDTDRRTQSAFFNHPFSLGWVIDPKRGEQAWFLGPDARALAPDAVLTIEDSIGEPRDRERSRW